MSDLFESANTARRSNVPELSVSELSGSVQRALEEGFGRERVRGEIAGMKLAASGHLYADLKDEDANLNIICSRTTVQRLKIKPEDGLEVICTGKITTYPKSSRYQMIVDSIELAGEGALLKMLEDRKKKLAVEGLFVAERKVALPYLPRVIGVVTSPTGAVIRDILHRLNDRTARQRRSRSRHRRPGANLPIPRSISSTVTAVMPMPPGAMDSTWCGASWTRRASI